jgi:dihydrofolate reductase
LPIREWKRFVLRSGDVRDDSRRFLAHGTQPRAEAATLVTRRLRYQVAVSLDGFIAGPNGEYDWIVPDPSVDFAALYKEFDTAVMGRKTYEVMTAQGGNGSMPGLDVVVFSRTMPAAKYPGVRILNEDPRKIVAELKEKRGRDIWLFGGGELFRSLLDAGLVDTVEVAVNPVLLGAGIPLLPPGSSTKLVLSDVKRLSASGIVALAYSVEGAGGAAPRNSIHQAGKESRKESSAPWQATPDKASLT